LVTLEFRERLDLGASLDFLDYPVQTDLQDLRETEDMTEIQDLRVLVKRGPLEWQDRRDRWDHQGWESRASRDRGGRLENTVGEDCLEAPGPWDRQDIASFATPWPCRPTGAPARRDPDKIKEGKQRYADGEF